MDNTSARVLRGGNGAGKTAVPASLTVLAGSIPLLAVFAVPRTAPAMLLTLAAAALVGNLFRRNPPADWFPIEGWVAALYVFAGWSLLSIAWSPVPWHSLNKVGLLFLFVTATAIAVQTANKLEYPAGNRLTAAGFTAATLLATLVIAFEVVSNQFIARHIIDYFPSLGEGHERHVFKNGGEVVRVSVTTLNRRVAVLALLLWPAVAAVYALSPARWRLACCLLTASVIGITVMLSEHQSSQLALAISLAVLVGATVAFKTTARVLAVLWVLAFLAIVPASQVPFQAGLHKASWLFESARHRVIIWNYFGARVAEKPLVGVGADATPFIPRPDDTSWISQTPKREYDPRTSRHPHNGFLQIWYELGLIGVVLTMVIGLVALRASGWGDERPRDGPLRAMMVAHLVLVCSMSVASYSIWQPWYQATMLLSVVVMANAVAWSRRDDVRGN